ncbi:uncharacterized protein LOC124940660 [Impatiens glandulifera]|uniref:uncharacterized protein LOC124940660 n=1 Tax=Impatiens glandulifera TaxID=253017 RepID=UPI001FB05A50|nr:uncharacterized protein LOC124940660 [Impatiens glandulifera]
MARCSSCNHNLVPRSSAKLILRDGTLKDFDTPVKISHFLDIDPSSFICDSDNMEFNNYVSALKANDELRLGHLYFALPISWLKHPIRPADMAGLAVKASSAFMMSNGGGGGGLVQCDCALGVNDYSSSRKVKKAKGDGRRRKYYRSEDLSVIPE